MVNINSAYSLKTKLRELILHAYVSGKIDRESAIARIGVSNRQFIRLTNKYHSGSLHHGLCGKASNSSISSDVKASVLALCKTKYQGWNYEHIQDTLLLRDGLDVSSATIRNWLLSAKISHAKRRKPRKYSYREPKARFNQMLQLDGTFGDFLGDGNELCLMHLVDDATKTSLAMLFESECTNSALNILYEWCLKYGIPESIYTDRHSTYKVNDNQKLTIEEELEGNTIRLSEFGKLCDRLNIAQIFAYSPQAKGRVEKKHQLYKDRWVKELRLDGIKTIAEANEYLRNQFSVRLNKLFTIEPREAKTACDLPTPADLAEQFAIQTTRTVRNDYTVSLDSIVYQLHKNSVVNARSKVLIKHYMDGSIRIFSGKIELQYTIIDDYKTKHSKQSNNYRLNNKPITTKFTPPKDHPFRQYKPERKYRYATSSKQLQELGSYYG